MSTTQAIRPAALSSTSSVLAKAGALVKGWILGAHDARTADTSDVWTLYRMTRGSDSVKPAVLRKLAADAVR